MPAYAATGIVLHRVNLGEADKILTLYTPDYGKLSAVAKGARRPGSRISGATELFMQSKMLLATGRSLDIMTQCEIVQSFPRLRNELALLARATYLCELLDRFTADRDTVSAPELFQLLITTLHLLEHAGERPDMVVHAYELRLLATQGYAPVLEHCVVCGNPLDRRAPGFSPSLGGVLCGADRYRSEDAVGISFEAIQILQTLMAAELEELVIQQPGPKANAEIDRAMRWYIRYRADRALKSAEFLDQLRESETA